MLGHNSLSNLYQTEFSLVQHHKYSLSEIENMMPYELDIYVNLLLRYLKEQEELLKSKSPK